MHAVVCCCCSKDECFCCCWSKAQLGTLLAGRMLQLWAWCCWLSGTWAFLRVSGSHLISAEGKEIASHSANLRLAIWKLRKMSVPGFSVVKNVDGLSKKTFLDILLLRGETPKQNSTQQNKKPKRTSEGCLILFFVLLSFSALPGKMGEVFEWVVEGLSLLSPLAATPATEQRFPSSHRAAKGSVHSRIYQDFFSCSCN